MSLDDKFNLILNAFRKMESTKHIEAAIQLREYVMSLRGALDGCEMLHWSYAEGEAYAEALKGTIYDGLGSPRGWKMVGDGDVAWRMAYDAFRDINLALVDLHC